MSCGRSREGGLEGMERGLRRRVEEEEGEAVERALTCADSV